MKDAIAQLRRRLNRSSRAPRWVIGLFIIGLFLVEPLTPHGLLGVIAKLEAIAYDARLQLTMAREGDPQVVIVDIDEKSLQREGHWPWPRDKVARLLTQLLERQQARAIGMDIVFAEPDPSDALAVLKRMAETDLRGTPGFSTAFDRIKPSLDYDLKLANAIRGKNVVLAYGFSTERQQVGALPPPVFTRASLQGGSIPIAPEIGYTANLPSLQAAAAGAGHFDPSFDSDNVVRRVPLVKSYGDAYYSALSLALVQVALESKQVAPLFDKNGELESLDAGGLSVPVSPSGIALVPYRGPKGTFKYFAATDVLAGSVEPDAFAGAIVLIGTTAKGLQDLRSTPLGPDFPGVEIHANLISGMLNGELLNAPPGARETEAVVMLIAGLLVLFAVPYRSPLVSVAGTLFVTSLVIAGNLYMWNSQRQVIPLAATLLMLLALLGWTLLAGFLREARAIKRLSSMFGEYLPRERVAQMQESGESFSLVGESREMTVLFSDVRDFTAVSEGLVPEQLSAMMNAYLTPMTQAIHEHHGTIDKYIGDAIMAFWGAPVANGSHARDAVLAALAMQVRIETLAAEFAPRGWPALRIGVGLNSGTMNVGDMGSEFRKAYTVLGDAVNLASRLEGLTKEYGVGVLIGEATRNAVPDVVCLEIDRVRVKGRATSVSIFEPIGETPTAAELEEIAKYSLALALYRARDFAAARAAFEELAVHSRRAHAARLFAARCADFIASPPGEAWDGATNFVTK